MGDLPVPPTDKLPTQIRGKPKDVDLRIFFLYIQLRTEITSQNKIANGRSKTRKDFKNQLENICPLRCDTKI